MKQAFPYKECDEQFSGGLKARRLWTRVWDRQESLEPKAQGGRRIRGN
jgi:hypothetical protein